MAKQKSYRSGGKIAGSHGTVIEAATAIVDCAHRSDHVSKVILGVITNKLGSRNRKMKVTRDKHALKVAVTDGGGHQILYVYTTDYKVVAALLTAKAREVGMQAECTI